MTVNELEQAPLHDPVRGESEPDRLWTLTNAAEATPDILSPLCWSVWQDTLETGWLGGMCAFGVVPRKAVVSSPDANVRATGSVYGRQAMNFDALRPIIARLPGVDVNDFERDILGSVRPGLPQPPAVRRRLPIIAFKLPYAMLTYPGKINREAAAVRQWWSTDVYGAADAGVGNPEELLRGLKNARDRFSSIFVPHVVIRFQLQAIQGAVVKAATAAGKPELASAALTAQGGLTEMKLADDVWQLAQGTIDETSFLAERGFHGPNEGNVYTRSWREEQTPLRNLVKAYRGQPDKMRPQEREAQAAATAERARAELLSLASRKDRPTLKFMFARARNVVPNLEVGKAAYLMTLDGARFYARRLGAALVHSGRLDEVDDVFFLDIPELEKVVAGVLGNTRELVAYRRDARKTYQQISLPTQFRGIPDEESVRTRVGANEGPIEVKGVAWGGPTVKGRARVLTDPNEDIDMEDGDILVCRFTDPSWAPLFSFVDAVVIDLGGAASHGAVVAREMGLTYVIGTENGTVKIPDGADILVDGTTGVVSLA